MKITAIVLALFLSDIAKTRSLDSRRTFPAVSLISYSLVFDHTFTTYRVGPVRTNSPFTSYPLFTETYTNSASFLTPPYTSETPFVVSADFLPALLISPYPVPLAYFGIKSKVSGLQILLHHFSAGDWGRERVDWVESALSPSFVFSGAHLKAERGRYTGVGAELGGTFFRTGVLFPFGSARSEGFGIYARVYPKIEGKKGGWRLVFCASSTDETVSFSERKIPSFSYNLLTLCAFQSAHIKGDTNATLNLAIYHKRYSVPGAKIPEFQENDLVLDLRVLRKFKLSKVRLSPFARVYINWTPEHFPSPSFRTVFERTKVSSGVSASFLIFRVSPALSLGFLKPYPLIYIPLRLSEEGFFAGREENAPRGARYIWAEAPVSAKLRSKNYTLSASVLPWIFSVKGLWDFDLNFSAEYGPDINFTTVGLLPSLRVETKRFKLSASALFKLFYTSEKIVRGLDIRSMSKVFSPPANFSASVGFKGKEVELTLAGGVQGRQEVIFVSAERGLVPEEGLQDRAQLYSISAFPWFSAKLSYGTKTKISVYTRIFPPVQNVARVEEEPKISAEFVSELVFPAFSEKYRFDYQGAQPPPALEVFLTLEW